MIKKAQRMYSFRQEHESTNTLFKGLYPTPTLSDKVCSLFISAGVVCGLIGMPVLLFLRKLGFVS